MAHITEVRIEGLLGREEPVKLRLNRDVNIFFGENGSGKTTLLKVLDAALSQDGEAMQRLPVTKAVVDIFSITEDRVVRHTWERREPGVTIAQTKQLDLLEREFIETADGRFIVERTRPDIEWKLTPARKESTRRAKHWAHTFLPTTRLYFGDAIPGRLSAARSQLSERELDQLFSESVNRAWLQFYSQTLTEVRRIQESGLRTVLRQVLNPGHERSGDSRMDSDIVHRRVGKFLARQPDSEIISLGSAANFRKRYEQDSDLRRIVDNLDNVERQIERAMIPVDSFIETISSLFSRGKTLTLTSNELQVALADGRNLSIAGLSSGEKHLIKILLSTMTAGPNAVLIDEPELSMHIDWQRVFVRTMLSLNPDSQLILATHSPELMAEIDDSHIFKL